jgi:hypothetical protein
VRDVAEAEGTKAQEHRIDVDARCAGIGGGKTQNVREGACAGGFAKENPAELGEAEKMLRAFAAMEKQGR